MLTLRLSMGTNEDFAPAKSLNILLIRRAVRATFPDMGRLLLSELPSTDGEKAVTFSKGITFSKTVI